jgi:hypothetical protein
MESCSNQKSVKQIFLHFRFFKVATLCLDDCFANSCKLTLFIVAITRPLTNELPTFITAENIPLKKVETYWPFINELGLTIFIPYVPCIQCYRQQQCHTFVWPDSIRSMACTYWDRGKLFCSLGCLLQWDAFSLLWIEGKLWNTERRKINYI